MPNPRTPLLLCLLTLAKPLQSARAHAHLEIVHRDHQLHLVYFDFDTGEADPDAVVLHVALPAARAVPDLRHYTSFLGDAGSTTWILPENQNADLLWLGIGSGGVRATDFTGPLNLALQSFDGPGHFALFQDGPFGQPVVLMNTRDGVGPEDAMPLPPGSHVHSNWAFSAPGRYRLTFTTSGTLRSTGARIHSAPATFHFDVAAPPPPRLTLSPTATNSLQLTLHAHPGLHFAIESTEDLLDWIPLTVLQASPSGPSHLLPPPLPSSPARFFRARLR